MNWIALIVFVLLFGFITVLGFVAANWRRGDLDLLHEWGLGGRRFGSFVIWFLLGGDAYTAYTFVAVPALVFGSGAIGFFAVPYTILIYPLMFLVLPRLWTVAQRHGYITAADFVRGRYGNRWLALAVAVTGIVATMPYIALQLVGLEVVIGAMGVEFKGAFADLPLVIAFVILAAFTYTSGLRAPAMIAVVKDALIYLTVLAMVIVIPIELGGYDKMFAAVPAAKLLLAQPKPGNLGQYSAYATLALGSAFALFLYPHTITGVLSASSRGAIRRNAVYLPAYSLMLALLALTGFMALAMGVDKLPEFAAQFQHYKANFTVPALILHAFPAWFVGVAFAAIGIGALVPAAIMSIAASNLFTRNIYREFIRPDCTPRRGGAQRQVRLARREARRAGLHHRPADAIRHPAPASRRHLDQPDHPSRDHRALYALAASLGASRRLGCGHPRGHLDGGLAEFRGRLSARARRHRPAGLCSALRLRDQSRRLRPAHASAGGARRPARRRRDPRRGL